MRFHPLIQISRRYFSGLKRVYHTKTLTSNHISSLHSHFWVQISAGSPFLPTDKNGKFLRFLHHHHHHHNNNNNFKIFSLIDSDEISPRSVYNELLKLISIGSYFTEVRLALSLSPIPSFSSDQFSVFLR